MLPEWLNYPTSFLNPVLKIIAPLILLVGIFYFYQASRKHQGEMGTVVRRLILGGAIGVLAMGFRYAGDIVSISWKWGESVGWLLWALANLYAVWPLVRYGPKLPDDLTV
jgi:RsiW-degrading membrane proteinase PrsW (M82 family)